MRDCLKVRAQKQPDDWTTFNTRSMLGGSLLGQKQYAEAEPLLLEGYQGMKQREQHIPKPGKPRLSEALDRLIELYDAWGKKDEAAKWRAIRDGQQTPDQSPPRQDSAFFSISDREKNPNQFIPIRTTVDSDPQRWSNSLISNSASSAVPCRKTSLLPSSEDLPCRASRTRAVPSR